MKIKPTSNIDAVRPIPTMSKTRIIKNVVVLSTGVMVLFIAYDGLTMLQSTMNSEQGIGVLSQAVLYICFCVSALVFPKYVIKKLGSKLTLVLSMLSYIPYVGSNFYPHWSVMMPTSVLLGFGAALLWGSQANYLNDVSVLYAELLLVSRKKDTEVEKGDAKERRQSNGGCRCISCVYVEYDGSDSCPLEDQPKESGAETKLSQKSVANFDVSELGHPLSSSECRSSCKVGNRSSDNRKQSISEPELFSTEHSDSDRKASGKDHGEPNQKLSSKPKVDSERGSFCEVDKSGNHSVINPKDSIPKNKDHAAKHSNRIGVKDISESNQNMPSKPKVDSECRLSCKNEKRSKQNGNDSIPKNNADHSADYKNFSLKTKVVDTTSSLNRSRAIESTTARFFGFHGLAFLSSVVWSNLMSYYVLHGDERRRNISNYSLNDSFDECGADFCGFESADQHVRQMPSDAARFALTGVCVCLGLASVLFVALFLDPLDDKSGDGAGFSLRLLTATVRLAKRTELLLLMPLSMYIGMAKGFYTGDFSQAFVGCALGPSHVGLVAVCYGASCALSSLLSGWAVRRVGRPALFAGSALLNYASCTLLLTWTPDAERPIIFFAVAGMWGFQVGTVWSQIRAFYGVLFKADEEAAFATFHTWFSLGFCLSFAYSNFLCASVKIYVLLAVSTVGYAGYFAVERLHAGTRKH